MDGWRTPHGDEGDGAGTARAPTPAWRAIAATVGLLAAVTFAAPGANAAPQGEPAPLALMAGACTTDNPYFVSPVYPLGERNGEPALVAFHDSVRNAEKHVLARFGEIGVIYGLAVDQAANVVYAAAYQKRGAPFGPGGPGMIYRIDLATGAVEPWLDVPDAAPPGIALHDPEGNYMPDRLARQWPGKVSLGDIDLNEDASELYVVNAYSRKILRYRTADKALLSTIDHGAARQGWATREARPFALAVHDGKLYHGVIRDASTSRQVRDLDALVYESELDGSEMVPVLALDMDYYRGKIAGSIDGEWLPWRDDTRSIAPRGAADHAYIYPMPMLTDLEFSDDGRMILGFRDRLGDMALYDRNRNLPSGEKSGHPFGDIVLATRAGKGWTATPWPEFFRQDAGGGLHSIGGFHIDTGFGGLARVRAADVVVNTAVSPEVFHSGGAIWFDLATGGDLRRETLYESTSGRTNFGKSNGMGDLELICPAVPVTPTPTNTPSPTATATTEASATPTPTATATPTATTVPRYTIYLPYGEAECLPEKRHVDVVLVLDRSTSMLRSVEPGGVAKNEAAIAAARTFVDLLQLEPDAAGRYDQVAVVGFNDTAWTAIGLTHDRAAANAALLGLRDQTAEGTRLDLALDQGRQPLLGPERILANKPVMILLTDGLPNRVPIPEGGRQEDTVLGAAQAVKDSGTELFTIGLGGANDINALMMIDAASAPYDYRYAPRPEDLDAIYRWILDRFTYCGRENAPPDVPCIPEFIHTDVVLILDMSTSMSRPTRSGRTKRAAAIAAAHEFVDLLGLELDGWGKRDRVAVAGFNHEAWTAIELTDERARVHTAIDDLTKRVHEGTRLDLALDEGRQIFERTPPLPGNRPIIVLLTDGLPNQVPFPPGGSQEQTVIEAAQRAKAMGARVFTIGLGEQDDVLRTLLESVATSRREYLYAPDGEDLAAVYREIAGRIVECE